MAACMPSNLAGHASSPTYGVRAVAALSTMPPNFSLLHQLAETILGMWKLHRPFKNAQASAETLIFEGV